VADILVLFCLCHFWSLTLAIFGRKDRCQFGDDCTYRHDCTPEGGIGEAKKSLVCPFFLKGKCRHRSRCYFSHPLRLYEKERKELFPSTTATRANCTIVAGDCVFTDVVEVQTRTSQPDSNVHDQGRQEHDSSHYGADICCVCMKIVAHKGCRFALYENCSHCVCFDCAKANHIVSKNSMREAGVDVGNTLIKHFCPRCCVESDYIIPSKYFYVDKKKDQVIADYIMMRAGRACKFHRIGLIGSCPFGANCFYAHYDSDGTDIKFIDFPLSNMKKFAEKKGSNSEQKRKYVLHNLLTRRF